MSLRPTPFAAVLSETARVARAVLPRGNLYMKLRDCVEPILQAEDFVPLFAQDGVPGGYHRGAWSW